MKQIQLFTGAELRSMLQPAAEAAFQFELNAKLKGQGNPLPFRMQGIRGVGKTSQGLHFIASRMEARGWKTEIAPKVKGEMATGKALAWLGKICQANVPTVIVWDEADCFPWEAVKELISSNGKPVEFSFSSGEGKETAVYNPALLLWLLASNFSVDNGERGAGESRTLSIPFLPYNDDDKLTLWGILAKEMSLTISPECLAFLAANSLPIGRDIEKQALALRSVKLEVESLDLANRAHVREALLYRGYYPRGMMADHIAVLNFLSGAPLKRNGESYGYTLSDIREHALSGRDETEMVDSLAGAGMVIRTPGGRRALTDAALDYLEGLRVWEEENAEALERAKLPLDKWKTHFVPAPAKSKGKKGGKAK